MQTLTLQGACLFFLVFVGLYDLHTYSRLVKDVELRCAVTGIHFYFF